MFSIHDSQEEESAVILRALVICFSALTILGTVNASNSNAKSSSGWVTLPRDVIGCRTQEQLLKLVQLLKSGDQEAAKAYMAQENAAYNCVVVTKGEVHIDDVYPSTGPAAVSCLRGRGDTTCYWVPNSQAF
jgi:hypothetical protein